MAIILGGVTLSDHMVWADEIESDQAVAQTFKRTLGGASVILHQALSKGRSITLTATQKQGWLNKTQVLAIKALAEQAGAVFTLTIGVETFSVMFRNHEPPSFIAEPMDQIGAQAPTTGIYTATINLMTV